MMVMAMVWARAAVLVGAELEMVASEEGESAQPVASAEESVAKVFGQKPCRQSVEKKKLFLKSLYLPLSPPST